MSNLGALQPRMFFQGFRDGDLPTKNYPRVRENLGLATGVTLVPIGDLENEDLYQYLSLFLTGSDSAYLSFADISPDFLKVWEPAALFMGSFSTVKATRFALTGEINERGNLILGGDEFRNLHVALERLRGADSYRYSRTFREDILYTVQFNPRTSTKPIITPTLPYHSVTGYNDVALVFPFEKASSSSVLWARRQDLADISSYFRSMSTSGFSESTKLLLETSKITGACARDLQKIIAMERKTRRPASLVYVEADTEEEASDTHDNDVDMLPPAASTTNKSNAIRYIVVRDTDYITYEALLSWALTGVARFASLGTTGTSSQRELALPQSVYKLAHQLDIPGLQAFAAENFEAQLTPFNVLDQLFSPDCFTYPVLRHAGLRVLEQQWARVKEFGGLDNLFKLVEAGRGDTQEMMKVAIEILRRV